MCLYYIIIFYLIIIRYFNDFLSMDTSDIGYLLVYNLKQLNIQ